MRPGISISSRTTSGFPLSIGTGLAFESLFSPTSPVYDNERKVPTKANLASYDTFWINLTTLFRNIFTAIPKDQVASVKQSDLFSTLLEEIDVIVNLVDNSGAGTKIQFYYSTYNKLELKVALQTVKSIKLRTPNTEKQLFQHEMMLAVVEAVCKLQGDHIKFGDAIEPTRRDKALVLTHQPYDLTNTSKFDEISLLESNTGLIKPKHQFNSKYYPIPNVEPGVGGMGSLPFHRKLLLVFGDKSLISPMPLVFRLKIIETAKKRHWTPLTTMDKMNLELGLDFTDPFMAQVWKSI